MQGKDIYHASHHINLDHFPEIIFLQEVGGSADIPSVQPVGQKPGSVCLAESSTPDIREVVMGRDDDWRHYRVFVGRTQSHLAQVIAVDSEEVESIAFFTSGMRYIAVGLKACHFVNSLILISVHLPHVGDGIDVFQHACDELISFILRYPHYNFIIGGDWNCQPGDDRHDRIAIPLCLCGFQIHYPDENTRIGRHSSRCLDYFVCGGPELSGTQSSLRYSPAVSCVADSHISLGSDHLCVMCDFVFQGTSASMHSRRKRHFKRCHKWCIDNSQISQHLPSKYDFSLMPLEKQWEILKDLSQKASYRKPGMKFVDSPGLKELCRKRRLAEDPEIRLALTRAVLARRQIEKESWTKSILDMAVKGNFDAIHNIFHQHRDKVSFDEAIAAYGSKQSFVNAVHDFFVHKAGAGDGDTVHAENPRHVPDFDSVSDFTEDEILRAVHRLKPGKTAGPSGCSADFLKALCSAGPGLQLLQSHLNLILRNCPLDEQRVAELVLVPKLLHIGSVDQFRPIALMECIHKLYMALLVHRIQPTWDEPRFQMGGYPGSQVLSALFCATAQLEKQSLEGKHGIWISADIKSAFDTVSWSKLESSLYDNTPDAVYPELQRLLHEIKSHHISLHWEGRKSHIPLARGVLQGGTHSAQVFSMMMEALFTELYKRWSHEHPGEVRGWCYIDDCLLWFSSWNVLQSVYPWLLERFAEYGFAFNPRKSVLCSTVEGLRKGNACRPHLHPDLQTFQWSTSFKYLGLHLEIPSLYLEDGENLTASLFKQAKSRVIGTVRTLKQLLAKQHHARWYTAVQLLNVFVASKWLWMCPCMHATRAKLDDVQSLQLGILCSVLNLYVPDGLQLDRRQALHRIRRRAVLELLRLQCPTMQWTWSWISRKWCFLGHLLRRPCQHQATATLLEPIKQVRSGRAVTGGRWLVSTFKAIGYQVEDVEALYNLYWTKEDWSEHLPQVMKAHQIPVPSLLPEWKASTWRRWNHAFTHDMSWFGTSVVVQTPDCINFKWLQPEHGWMQHSVSGTWETAIQDHCRWHAMSQTRPLFTIQLLFSETSHPETKLSVQQAVHALYVNRTECRELVPVILLEIVPESWVNTIYGL